jgi:threonylcarbamoyladenosine tRNA methylthiotransferase MtaB
LRPVYIKTFGCKVNYAESVDCLEQLHALGVSAHEMTGAALAHVGSCSTPDEPSPAPVVIVNSCCVTAEAERKALQFTRRIKRECPGVEVLLTGCSARHPKIRKRYVEAGALLFEQLAGAVVWLQAQQRGGAGVSPAVQSHAAQRSRAFIKVQDGCTCHCSYCIIPQVRPYYSRPLASVLEEVEARLGEGYRELVLTGVNLGHYGRTPLQGELAPGQPASKLHGLISAALDAMPEGTRLRLSSIEPEDATPAIIELFSRPRLCPHLHLPLQSGSDAVLTAMRRSYTVAEYMGVVKSFRVACPDGAITTDILTGYPTETEADFQATLELCTRAGFERVHGFPFSCRPGTAAEQLPALARSIVQARNRKLIAHCAEIADQRWRRFLERDAEVLIEERKSDGWLGHGAAYQIVRVQADGQSLSRGSIVPVRLVGYGDGMFRGELAGTAR